MTVTSEDVQRTTDQASAARVEHEIDRVHDDMTDAEIVAAYNAYRKRRMKLDLDSAVLNRQIASSGLSIDGRPTCYVDGEGIAHVDDGQGSLFES